MLSLWCIFELSFGTGINPSGPFGFPSASLIGLEQKQTCTSECPKQNFDDIKLFPANSAEVFTGTKTGEFAMVDAKSTCGKTHVLNEGTDLWQYLTSQISPKNGSVIHSLCFLHLKHRNHDDFE